MDLDRPYKVRRIFDAISSQNVVGNILNLFGEERSVVVLAELTGPLNGPRMSMWDKASFLYDEFGVR